jgi:hypothetical protein
MGCVDWQGIRQFLISHRGDNFLIVVESSAIVGVGLYSRAGRQSIGLLWPVLDLIKSRFLRPLSAGDVSKVALERPPRGLFWKLGGSVPHDLPLEETTDSSKFICVPAPENHIVLRLERHDEIVVIAPDRYSSPDSIVGGIIGYCWHAAPMSTDQ